MFDPNCTRRVASAGDWWRAPKHARLRREAGREKLRFEVQIQNAESRKPVVRGYTVHAFTDRQAKPLRPPPWFLEMLTRAADDAGAAMIRA